MPKVGVSLLHSAWGLSWANLNSLVLESSEGVLIHFSGAWAGMSQRLGSAGMVDYDAIMWTSSQHGDLRAVRLLTLLLRAPRVGPLVTGRSLKDFPGGTSGKEADNPSHIMAKHLLIILQLIPYKSDHFLTEPLAVVVLVEKYHVDMC